MCVFLFYFYFFFLRKIINIKDMQRTACFTRAHCNSSNEKCSQPFSKILKISKEHFFFDSKNCIHGPNEKIKNKIIPNSRNISLINNDSFKHLSYAISSHEINVLAGKIRFRRKYSQENNFSIRVIHKPRGLIFGYFDPPTCELI